MRSQATFPAPDYNLALTLNSGQAFRWEWENDAWAGVIGNRWVRLRQDVRTITAETAEPVSEWDWLLHYLQCGVDLQAVLGSFPDDEPMRAATLGCRGLRLLRQPPWECLASFILSSTKQIVQIRQIVASLCRRYGEPLPALPGHGSAYAFPTAANLANATETELRLCKMGYRAPYLLKTAQLVAQGLVDLEGLQRSTCDEARQTLLQLPGVGRKVADCVLLFAYGFQEAFPVDVWVLKALKQLYFPGRRVKLQRLRQFAATHFGRNAGYAQQYLFQYMRTLPRTPRQFLDPGQSAR
jgi:N-glycosylase/DNA lyase